MLHHAMRRVVAGVSGGYSWGPDDIIYLRSNSTDDSTDFTGLDLGPNSYAVANVLSRCQHESTNALPDFGTTSMYRNAAKNIAGTLLIDPMGTNAVFAANTDFTLEFFVRFGEAPNNTYLVGRFGSGPEYWLQLTTAEVLSFYFSGFIFQYDWSATFALNTWYHICLDRYGTGANNFGLFIAGTQVSVVSNNNEIGVNDAIDGLPIMGTETSSTQSMGFGMMDAFRISNGTSLYQNTNFTPPANPIV